LTCADGLYGPGPYPHGRAAAGAAATGAVGGACPGSGARNGFS